MPSPRTAKASAANSKRTPETIERICEALRAGNTRKASAHGAGISHETFYRWIEDPDVRERVQKAEAEAEKRAVRIIQDAMPKTWQSAAWWLERRRPDWRLEAKHQDPDSQPGVIEVPAEKPDA